MRRSLFEAGTFAWLLGIEDTCVYPAPGDPDRLLGILDEHVLTDHHTQWRDDLRTAAELGADAIRYGMSWPLVHIAPGRFDWTHLDEVVDYAVDQLGIDIVADLVHYGTPTWLPNAFADVDLPDALAEFAGALASRYAGRIRAYTPVNEPLTTASFSGLRAVWPPYRSGWQGWVAVTVPIALAAAAAHRAIKAADPHALIVHVEASSIVDSIAPGLDGDASLLQHLGWLPTDLLLGRVDDAHPMRRWLLDQGASAESLQRLVRGAAIPDVMGVNYYPDLTPRRLHELGGRVLQVAYDAGAEGLARVLRAFRDRYGLPLVVTETSIEGDDERRTLWLRDAVSTVAALSGELDLRGMTWWPLFDFVDWSYASAGVNVEEFAVETLDEHGAPTIGFARPLGDPADGKDAFLRRMGLIRLEERADGSLRRIPTPAAAAFADATARDRTASAVRVVS